MTKFFGFFKGDRAFIVLCLIALIWIFSFRNFVYFRDYSILFEGSYRIYLGQVPFRDFGLPMGPGSFLIPTFFFKLLGVNWDSFLWAQQFQNCLMLLVLLKLLIQLNVDLRIRRISLLFFSLFYLIFLSQPWYNTSAVLFMLISVSFAMCNRAIFYILSGIFVGITILTKQDFGILSACIAFFALIFNRSKFFVNAKSSNNPPINPRLMAVKVFMFLTSIIFVVSAFIFFTNYEQFNYWFNYGQSPHNLRYIYWTNNLTSLFIVFGVFIIGLFMRNFNITLSSAFLFASFITNITSGLPFTHYYFVAFIPIIWDESRRMKFRWKSSSIAIILFFLFLSIKSPLRDVFYIFESMALRQPEHYFFNYRMNSSSMIPMGKNLNSFSNKIFAPQETVDSIIMIKDLVKKLKLEFKVTSPLVLNMTELTSIYTEINVEPPKGLPLWFHSSVSLFPKQIDMLNQQLSGFYYDVILVQGTHEGLTPTYQNFLSILNANKDYKLISQVKNTPAKVTSPWLYGNNGDIFIYTKKEYANP
jgi:hypothetical protein